MKSFLQSFRGRLTLWSVGVLAFSLVVFSYILGVATVRRIEAQIDRDLAERARRMGPGGPPMGGPRGPLQRGPEGEIAVPGGGPGVGPGLGRGPGPGGMMGGEGAGRQGGFRGGENPGFRGQPMIPPAPRATGDAEIDFLQSVRRPRFFNAAGEPVNRFAADAAFDKPAVVRALGGEEGYTTTSVNGEPVRVFTYPMTDGEQVVGAVQIARELRDVTAIRNAQARTLLALIPLALLFTALGAFLLAGRALRPLGAMREAAARIGEGDLARRLEVQGDDELAQLGSSFNEMTERLQASFAEREAAYRALQEAYESQKRFTADASHELRTPLARLQLATSGALEGDPSGYRAALETANNAAQNIGRLVRQLLTLAQVDAGQLHVRPQPLDLRVVLSDAVQPFESSVELSLPDHPVMVGGDADMLGRVIANLLENAMRYSSGKPVHVSLLTHEGRATVEVRDEGEGIAPEHLPHLFERFYRVDPARARADGGCGLGLAIGKSLVEAHSGTISIDSRRSIGTTVRVELPLL